MRLDDRRVLHPVFDFPADELAVLRACTPDRAMAEAAARRDGVLSQRQLAALGLDAAAIQRRIARGSLFRRHRGVYAVGRADVSRRGEVRSALLRCGRGAVLSYRTAAWLLDLLGNRSAVDLSTTVRIASPSRQAGIRLHYVRSWLPGDVTWVDGLPCTSVERTLADLAGVPPQRDFALAWDNADRRELLDPVGLARQVDRARTGAGVLRLRLHRLDEAPPSESVLEGLFVDLCRSAGIREPRREWPLAWEDRSARVDFVWLPEGVAVEVDGRKWHAVQTAHLRDREKDLELREAGLDPHRYAYRQVVDAGPKVARAVAAALAARTVRC